MYLRPRDSSNSGKQITRMSIPLGVPRVLQDDYEISLILTSRLGSYGGKASRRSGEVLSAYIYIGVPRACKVGSI